MVFASAGLGEVPSHNAQLASAFAVGAFVLHSRALRQYLQDGVADAVALKAAREPII